VRVGCLPTPLRWPFTKREFVCDSNHCLFFRVPSFLVYPSLWSRKRLIDSCAQCTPTFGHGGRDRLLMVEMPGPSEDWYYYKKTHTYLASTHPSTHHRRPAPWIPSEMRTAGTPTHFVLRLSSMEAPR